jgi:hypothetical protein
MIEDLQRRLSQLQQLDVNKLLNEILISLSEDIKKMNTLDQLFGKGIKTTGESLPPYTPFTVKKKKEKNQRYDHMTLKDTGDFYAAWFVKAGRDSITLGSTDRKTLELMSRYSDVPGLTDENLDLLREKVKPLLIERLRVLEAN